MKTLFVSLHGRNAAGKRGGIAFLNYLSASSDTVSSKANYQSVPKRRSSGLAALAGSLILCGVGALPASATTVSLLLPQSSAFAILGHSCGGIQEHSYASGFDPASGYPVGDVYIKTSCGGSGRGGGYHTTTYSAWVSVEWDFGGHVLAYTKLSTAPTVDPTFSTNDVYGDAVSNINNVAYLTVPVPAAPNNVTAVQSGDQFLVSWTPNGANPNAITSSTLTATPTNSTASVLVATVSGASTNGAIASLQPQTTYLITVVSTTIGGSGPSSDPIYVTTAAASITPSAPTGVSARWAAVGATTATLVATWNAADPGDSPVDAYEVMISGSDEDGGGTFTQTVSGTTLTASWVVNWTPDWSVTVQAHNAAGWGLWSTRFTLGGL